jgi:hypothetical protein
MKIPEYKIKWLEKQLKLYDEQERYFFENFELICSMMMNQYLEGNQALAQEPLVQFLKQYANNKMRSYEGEAHLDFDADAYNINDCMLCAVWCIDLLQAYDKWRESEAMC